MTHSAPRPRRRRKADDRFISADASQFDGRITVDVALAPLDALHRAMDLKYGIDRLVDCLPVDPPAHVAPEQHEGYRSIVPRYGALCEALNKAIDADDVDAVREAVPRMIRAIQLMDWHCTQAGVVPDVQILEVQDQETNARVGFVLDPAQHARAEALRPDLRIMTLQDAAFAVLRSEKLTSMMLAAKKHFPGAEVAAVRKPTPLEKAVEDEIPF
jgi:hypothetical protein